MKIRTFEINRMLSDDPHCIKWFGMIGNGHRGIKALVEAAALAAVRAGVPKSDAVAASMKYEVDLMNAYASAEKRRRFLAAYKEAGAASQVAPTVIRQRQDAHGNRIGVTPRWARKLREKYLNEKGN